MRVTCDSCSASYKIPDEKLKKEVNKATCRKCGNRMLIRRPGSEESAPPPMDTPQAEPAHEKTQLKNLEDIEKKAREQEAARTGQATADPPPLTGHIPEDEGVPTYIRPDIPDLPATPTPPPIDQPLASKPASPRPRVPPRGAGPDLVLATVFLLACIAGSLTLVINPSGSNIQAAVGAFLAMTGATTALLILVTSKQGIRKANTAVSVLLGIFLGMALSFGAFLIHAPELDDDQLAEEMEKELAAEELKMAEEAKKAEAEAATIQQLLDEEGAEEDTGDLEEEEEEEEEEEKEDETTAKRESSSDNSASSSSSSSSSSRSSSSSSSSSSRSSEAAGPSLSSSGTASSGGGAMTTLPMTVVDTIIRNNRGVKKCFAIEKKENGTLPSRVEVRFTLANNGRVQSAAVPSGVYAGANLDRCLSGAFKALQFPPFSGDPLTLTYPFVL